MGKLFTGNGWIIKVQGAEHAPVHVHVLHPNGKAVLFLNGTLVNSGVPARVIADASAWVAENTALIVQEWQNMGNPEKR